MGSMHVLQTALVLLNADLRAYLWYRLVFVGQILVCYAEIAFGIYLYIHKNGNKIYKVYHSILNFEKRT
jgi:hypothetical protein